MNIKKVPVTIGFDNIRMVGILEIDIDALPRPAPDFCFSLGYKVLGVDDTNKVNNYELIQVGLVDDRGYLEYLKDKYGN